ncbi:MAG TPA: hypothetical protein VGH74_08240 [Planctomycetaceae bacterium]
MESAERSAGAGPGYEIGNRRGSPQPRQGRRWGRWILGGGILMLLLLVFAPQIVGWSPLRHELPRRRMPGFQGRIRVGGASLSWWGPTVLRDLELDAPDGKPFYKVAKVIEVPGAWGSVFQREEPIDVHLDHPVVTLVLRPDGSNVEDALAPVLEHPVKSLRRKTVVVTDGKLNAADSTTGRSAAWQQISLEATVDPQGASPNRLKLSAALADSPTAGPLAIEFNWSSSRGEPAGSLGKWEASLQTTDLPLTALGPVLGRFAPDLDLSGTVSTKVHLVSGSDPAATGNLPGEGDWQMTTQNLQVACPSRMGDEKLALDKAEFEGTFARGAAAWRIDRLKLTTDVCRVEGSGSIPLSVSATATDDQTKPGPASDANFNLKGDIDLVALARLLPQTLNIREGTNLTEGRISFEAGSRRTDQRLAWTGSVETSRIAASVAGEQVAWDEPLKFKFALHQEQNRTHVDSVELLSDLVHLTGRSNGDALHLDAQCDLARVISRLGQFIDTDKQELRGKLSFAADVTRDADGLLVIDSRGDAENVLIRRLVTRTVERRAGDLQGNMPGDAPPAEPSPPGPGLGLRPGRGRGPIMAPPPGRPLTRREMRAERKAERQAIREERREERELRKQADEIVRVPVHEWQTLWSEPHLVLTSRSRVHQDPVSIELVELGAESDGLTLRAQGNLAEVFSRCAIELNGQADYDLARLIERIRDAVGPHLQITGKESRQFSIKGPLRSPPGAAPTRPIVPLELAANGGLSWQRGDLFGVTAGPGNIDLTLAQGIVSMHPLDMAVSGGRLKLAPRLVLTGHPAMVESPAGVVIDGVVLTQELCDSWLKYIAPIVANATRTEGQISLALGETRLPLTNLAGGEVTGHVLIAGHVLPGPLFDEVNRFIGGIVSGIDGGPLRDWLGVDRPLVEIGRQEVAFELRDRRIYHSDMEFIARGIMIRTRGSVGLDQSLDVIATIVLSDEVLSRLRFLGKLQGRPLEIPIQGTLQKPQLARGAVGGLVEQLGQTILDRIFEQLNP